jgi:2-polyprenyl-3-methyl-5-hydroxy-6-metoxy-1,4-benzoquinol methylase
VTAIGRRGAGCDEPWPAEGLETLGHCPLCGAAERSLLFDGLCDAIFFVAPGRWTLWRCGGCGNGYLDPRPDAATIGRAYEEYYTHEAPWAAAPPATRLQRLRSGLANGYRNRRYGTRFSPAYAPGYWLGRLLRPLAEPSDVAYRFLERRPDDAPQPRLLDVGCGGGAFLAAAREAGWEAAGIDFDAKAVAGARRRGLDVSLGGLESVADRAGQYDAVTLSHVIEHLHDPAGALRTIRHILKPGGRLYVETPNLDSIGRRLYGRHWRGLEPPRHLVLFNRPGLAALLARSGFEAIRFRRTKSALAGLGLLSARIAAGLDPNQPAPGVRGPGRLDRLRSALSRGGTEFMTFTAETPRR